MRFIKMEGCGNDYIFVDCFDRDVQNPADLARRLSDRHFGVGSDGLILIRRSPVADCFMDIYDADGSRAEMCGNGIRCVGKYLYDHRNVAKATVAVGTLSGIKTLQLIVENGACVGSTVDMGAPILEAGEVPTTLKPSGVALNHPIEVDGDEFRVTCVSMGNPHAVMVVDDPQTFPVQRFGAAIERHSAFPNRVNAHFVKVHAPDLIEIRTWERGAGETLACGTGNCAALVAATLLGLSDGEADMQTLGGRLHIRWDRDNNRVYMTGPAREVFWGDVET